MLLPILKYGSPELKAVNQPVEAFSGELEKIAENMIETMYSAPGIGLAAPQVGMNIQMSVIDLSVGEDENQLITICNPRIVASHGDQKGEEGCLSIPGGRLSGEKFTSNSGNDSPHAPAFPVSCIQCGLRPSGSLLNANGFHACY